MAKQKPEKVNWNRQLLGALVGGLAGLALTLVFPSLERQLGALSLVLWSAALGAALASLEGFTRAGAALTHSPNRNLNLLVGLDFPLLVLLIIALLLQS